LSARREALSVAEQKVLTETMQDPEVQVLNDINAATAPNAARWGKVHDVAEGELSVETAPKYVVRIGEKWIFRGPWLGGAFAIVNVFQLFIMYRDIKMGQYVMAPYYLEDEQGVFTFGGEFNLFSANKYWKTYQNGPLQGQRVSISSDDFDFYEEEAHAMWGYADWKGDFVPGLFRRSLPEMDAPGTTA
jgi:hypothetical protein